MKLKKTLAASAACVLLVGALMVPASAHGGRHSGGTSGTYSVCTVANCTLNYSHSHNGVTYYGHSTADGHTQCAYGTGHNGRHH